MSDKETEKNNIQKKKGQGIIFVGIVMIIVLFVIIVILLVRENHNMPEEESRRNVVVNQENAEEIAEQLIQEGHEFVEPGYYTVNMNTHWNFSKGDAVSEDARVDNLIENTNDIYFDVFLADDESEAIYQSPVIPVGSYLENIVLDKPLDEGTYDCVIVYHLIDENQNTISTLRVAFKITVAL